MEGYYGVYYKQARSVTSPGKTFMQAAVCFSRAKFLVSLTASKSADPLLTVDNVMKAFPKAGIQRGCNPSESNSPKLKAEKSMRKESRVARSQLGSSGDRGCPIGVDVCVC